VERARNGEGPTLIECKTYRQRGHSRWDPAAYRPKEEVEEWSKRDPIRILKEHLLETKCISEAEAKGIEKTAADQVEKAVKFAIDSPYPKPEEALEDVYA